MTWFDLAQRGAAQLDLLRSNDLDEPMSDQAEAWLRDEVCPVVEQLAVSQSFRLTTCWPLENLAPGVNTPQRRLVTAVDEALVELARQLAAASEDQPARVALRAEDRATLELVAGRPWFDLVCPEEFFHAERRLHLLQSHAEHTAAFERRYELRVPLGDYVTRSMFARIEYWSSLLTRLWNKIFPALAGGGTEPHPACEGLFAVSIELQQATEQLTACCRGGEVPPRRDACAALTQVYAAYSPAPNLDWLGLPRGWAQAHAGLIRSSVRRRGEIRVYRREPHGLAVAAAPRPASLCDRAVIRGVAGALQDVAVFLETPADPDDLVEWATGRARLILVDRAPRQVFWHGREVSAGAWDTHTNAWNLLWTLALHPGAAVDQQMLAHPESHHIRSRRARLAKLLEEVLDLDALIETRRGQGYQLQLAAEDIFLLRDDGFGRLVFEGRGNPAAV